MKKLLSTLLFLFVVAILSAQTDVYPPSLMEPEDAREGLMPDVILNWAAVGGSGGTVEYEVQLDVTDAFTSAHTFDKSQLSGLQMQDLLFGQTYYWRVRAYEGTDVSDWSAVWSFTIFETIVLLKPNNPSAGADVNVELKAKSSIGAGSSSIPISGIIVYEFEADTSMNFDSDLLFEGHSDTSFVNTTFLHFGETYYWHARVRHAADTCIWSEVWSFETEFAPKLQKPLDGSTDQGLENELKWKPIEGVVDYEVQIADNDAFTGAHSAIVEHGFEYVTDGYLTFGTEYFWRVRANHATDTSDWAAPFTFTTISTVLLDKPDDEEMDVSILPLLEWEEVSGVDFYQVQYNNTNNFDDPCCDETVEGTDNFFQVVFILDYNTTFYWRARTMQGIDTTVWSDVWSFTTRPIDFGIDEAFDANNIKIYPNPSNGKLYINIDGDRNEEVSVRIMDMLGQVHIEENVIFGQGNTSKMFDLNNFANGLYIVKLTQGDHSYSHKITVHK
ncbi:MAG: hypothetical protein DRI97_06530 [Bacteroidetes bacterium]|nr:MAG: hypothetical protein DRI97_06530 [Bacteroidota bacterium]RLD82462.1 MAG: hypothetical protein DRJ15_01505 [Bacteroidota bacterium]